MRKSASISTRTLCSPGSARTKSPWRQSTNSSRGAKAATTYVAILGKHRVELARRELAGAIEDTITVEEEPLKSSLERGRLSAFDQERIVLGPYPTDEEWVDAVLRRNVEEVVSTLDPTNPKDAALIDQERQIAEDNGLTFTLVPLDPESPDPATVQEVAEYVRTLDHKVYVHEFTVAERFRALEQALQEEST